MDTRESSPQSFTPVTWPLIGSLILTTIVVAIVCVPPFSGVHSWGRLVWLACVYMLTAAFVHALAVWSIYRIQREGVREWTLVWPVVWGAWIAVVWLPLVALLTYERSHWVAAIVPLVAVFLTMFVVSRRRGDEDEDASVATISGRGMLWMDESPRLSRVLLPSLLIAVVIDGGVAAFAGNHAWIAGVLLAVAAAYFTERMLSRTIARVKVQEGSVRHGAAGNSVAAWMLTVVALLPFLAGMGAAMRGVLGMPAVQAAHHVAQAVHRVMRGYSGIILTRPRMPHQIVTPVLTANPESFTKQNKTIPFDGQYWYFQWPDSRPGADAPVVQGDPTKARVKSTDNYGILMEAHQRLAQPMNASCCRTLRVNVTNADAVPGKITLDVFLNDASGKPGSKLRLGSEVLPSSAVSPMPLHRAPVEESLVFEIPREAKGKRFDEITVRLRPERDRSLGAPEVAIESFSFQR